MWELILVSLVFCGSALLGFRWWIDRLHPIKPQRVVLAEEWERRFSKLKESVDDLTMGGKLRHRKDDEEDA